MSQTSYLVVGASRGIGYALVDELSQKSSSHVFASTRKPMDFGKSNVENIIIEQTDTGSIKAAASGVKQLDVLILNAAIGELEFLVPMSTERLREYLEANVIGVHAVINAFLPALKAGRDKKIIIISSPSGSLKIQKGFEFGLQGAYSVSKAAVNMVAVQFHNELYKENFSILAMNPGWVETDMGTLVSHEEWKPISPKESASGMSKVIDELTPEKSAMFLSYDGSELPW